MGWHEIGAYVGLSISGVVILLWVITCLYWCCRWHVTEDDVLELERGTVVKHGGRKVKMTSAALDITRFMDLHVDNCKKAPFSSVDMVSATDYAAVLHVPGNFNWQRATRTALVKAQMGALLPLTDFMRPPQTPVDPLVMLGGQKKTYSMLRDTLSPLHLYAMGELMNLAAAEQKSKVTAALSCVAKYLDGEREELLPPDMARLPEPFILDEHLPQLLEGLDPDAPVEIVQPAEGVEWLPDVSFSPVGRPYRCNEYEVKCGLVFAVLLNRLSANTMPDAWKPQQWRGRSTTVKLSRKSPAITSPSGLMRAISDDLGASMFMQIVSRITSFGFSAAMKQEDKWQQIPFILPVRTGVVMLDDTVAKSSGTKEIATLMVHAEVALRVKLPGKFAFRISWYQGMEGFTGWHGGNDTDLPWNNSDETEVKHSAWASTSQYAAAADVAAIVADVTNRMADELNLPNGGYGYLGVCNDSVATVQAALDEPVTMFPCILAGQAKTEMAQTYSEVSQKMRQVGGELDHVASVADQVRRGLLKTPCDVIHDPTTVDTAIRRIQACVPEITPFQTAEDAREDLRVALEQYQKSGLLYNTNGAAAVPRVSTGTTADMELPIPPV